MQMISDLWIIQKLNLALHQSLSMFGKQYLNDLVWDTYEKY